MQASQASGAKVKPAALARLERLTRSRDDPYSAIAIALLAVWALINWLLTIRRIMLDYNPLPVWDYWQVAEHLQRYKAFDLSVFWIQHNEHRIVFPEGVFALDMLLFGGHQIFPLLVSFGCYFGIWVILARVLRSDHATPAHLRLTAALLGAIIIGWEGSSVVVGNTFLLQWTMVQFVTTLALALLALAGRRSALAFAGSVACAVIATFSSGNGMLIWPILIAAALVLRLGVPRIGIIAAAGAASVWLFFVGYHASDQMHLLEIVRHPLYFICFIAAYAGMPLAAFGQPRIGVLFGLCNLAAWLFAFLVILRKRLLAKAPALVCFGSLAFLLASAILTAAGRMNPADPAYIAARAARYVSLPLVNWGVLCLLLVWLAAHSKWELLSVGNLAVVVAMLALGMTSALYSWITGNGSFIADQQVATLAVENNVFDTDADGKLYSDPNFVPKWLPVLRSSHLAIFSGYPEINWLGRKSGELFASCEQREPGEIYHVFPIQGGFEVTGKARLGFGASKVVFVNERNIVVGFGEKIEAGVPGVLGGPTKPAGQNFVGFINSAYSSHSFSTYLVSGNRMCPLASAQVLTGLRQIPEAQVGTLLPDTTWKGAGWSSGGLPPGSSGSNPLVHSFTSSWNGSDASTGKVQSSPVLVAGQHCLVVPVLHGPETGGLTVRILDAQTASEVASLPLRGGEIGWRFWRVPLPENVTSIRISAHDGGTAWGEWMAIASPFACRQ